MANLRAAAYARFSSDMQRDESIDAQIRAITAFAEQQGYVLLSQYVDKAISATTDKRPEFQRMIADAQAGKFDVILVHKLDRFSRNRHDSVVYRSLLKKCGVKLISVLENFQDNPESIILESVIESYNEYYSINLRREVMKGLRENALQCRHTGGTPCLGYDVDPTTQKLILNKYEAQAVKLIFKMYLDGAGYTEIIDTLNNNGYRTKRGNLFGKNSLFEILRNEKYYGVFTYNKSAAKNADGKFNRHQSKDDTEIIRVEGGVPAIISKAEFEAVQAKMAERKQNTAKFKAKQEYMLSGKVVCGICGCKFVGNARRPRPDHPLYCSYKCSKKNGAVKCGNKEIQKEALESIILDKLAECVFDESVLPKLLKRYNEFILEKDCELNSKIKALQSKLSETEKGINNIVDIVVKTGSAALSDKLKTLEDEKSLLLFALSEATSDLEKSKLDEKQLKASFKNAKFMLKSGCLSNRREIIERYVNQITMFPDSIEVKFNLAKDFVIKEAVFKVS